MKSLAIGLASGLGNCAQMLPAIKALKLMGHRIALYVQTDFPTADLWRRCIHADEILEPPASVNGHELLCGQWRPIAWANNSHVMDYMIHPPYQMAEWESNMRLARSMGWQGEAPDPSDWCRDLDRSPRWDVGIIPGCKTGVWIRKRWPGMACVADHFIRRGLKVAVFGLKDDGIELIPGARVSTDCIAELPDALAGCRVIIGADSGVTHLASSLGIPTVMVYTATSEVKAEPMGRKNRRVFTGITCRPCVSTARWFVCHDWKCQQVEPERVIEAVEELLR